MYGAIRSQIPSSALYSQINRLYLGRFYADQLPELQGAVFHHDLWEFFKATYPQYIWRGVDVSMTPSGGGYMVDVYIKYSGEPNLTNRSWG